MGESKNLRLHHGRKVWTASYLPFGGVETSAGSPIELRFPGQWFQSESGLHQNWMREYDPTTGRYLQADPLGLVDGPSVYGYALQNPGRYVDFFGSNSTLGGNDPGFNDPNVQKQLQRELNDPNISQKRKSQIRNRLREISRNKAKKAHESKKNLKPGRIPIPKLGPLWLIPGFLLNNPCKFDPMCIQASIIPDENSCQAGGQQPGYNEVLFVHL